MAKISITSETARRIVEVGTESVYSSVQRLKKPERTQQRVQQAGHLIGTLLNDPSITGPNSEGRISMDDIKDGSGQNVIWTGIKCPLLRENGKITKNSKVVLSRNLATGEWQIIEAQCPASASPSSGEGEEGAESGESGENNSGGTGSGESGEGNTNGETNQEEGQTEGTEDGGE